VKKVASLGGGPIGAGWAAHFLARGYDVAGYVHSTGEETAYRKVLDTAWISLTALGLAPGASLDRLTLTDNLEAAVADAGFVQESAPERLELKQTLYETLGRIVPPDTVIASSTSGLMMTDIQLLCPTPERTVIGHPFNPPYLLPLVEIIGGKKTSPDAVAWARDFYAHAGKAPLVMKKEIPGFVATRLQEALWREALHMVEAGEATVEEIDLSITEGPGLRWALQGPMLTFHLAGGQGGMAHMLDHFGPSLLSPWTRLEAPALTPRLRDAVVAGCEREAAGRSIDDLVAERDRGVIAILRATGRA
jgi:carnitine 3-dehydrogenase